MNFEFSEAQHLLRQQAQSFLREHASPAHVRAILDSEAPFDEALWRGIVDLGWTATTIPEAYGGLGLSYLELCVLAEELGRSLAPTPFSSSVYLATEAILAYGTEAQKAQHLPRLANGEIIGCYAVAEGHGQVAPARLEMRVEDGTMYGTKLPIADGDVADLAVVLTHHTTHDASMYLVDLHGDGVKRTPVDTLDPTRSHAQITFNGAQSELLGRVEEGWDQHTAICDRAAVLYAFEQVGGAQAALDMAKEYAMGRYAFGRPIASFQALKHKMADMCISPRPWPVPIATTALGPLMRVPRNCLWPRRPPASAPRKPSMNAPRKIFKFTAVWGLPGNSTATCTTAEPNCSGSIWAVYTAGKICW